MPSEIRRRCLLGLAVTVASGLNAAVARAQAGGTPRSIAAALAVSVSDKVLGDRNAR